MPVVPGQLLQQRYRIQQLLGQGGMGGVYLAEDTRLSGRRCAIKESLVGGATAEEQAELRQQFQREASLLAGLVHPNLPRVWDFFEEGGSEFLVMEFVAGEDLASLLARYGGPLPEGWVLDWGNQVLGALAYLHSLHPFPLIHRDVKPANIIVTPEGQAILVDFGLVKQEDPTNLHTVRIIHGMGTPGYTPLEQYGYGGSHTDARSDVYALGASLYHLLTNVPPPTPLERVSDPARLQPPRHLQPALSPYVEAAILQAMEVEPARRFESASAMRAALRLASAPLAPPPSEPLSPTRETPVVASVRRGVGGGCWVAVLGAGVLGVLALALVTWGVLSGGLTALTGNGAESTGVASLPTFTLETLPTFTSVGSTTSSVEPTSTAPPTVEPPSPSTATYVTLSSPTATLSPSPTSVPSVTPTLSAGAALRATQTAAQAALPVAFQPRTPFFATYAGSAPTADGLLEEWEDAPFVEISHVLFRPENVAGASDLVVSCAGQWTFEHFYLACRILDDVLEQASTGSLLYQGDSIELFVDADLAGDGASETMTGDDSQLGIVPGAALAWTTEVYRWFPTAQEGEVETVVVGSLRTAEGYEMEAMIPWTEMGITARSGGAYGFDVGVNDNDTPGTPIQGSQASLSPVHRWGNPTTWGVLLLLPEP